MKIALVGYGKMGHLLKAAAENLGNEVVVTIDPFAPDADVKNADSAELARAVKGSGADGVIEFTNPAVVIENLRALVPLGIPLVVGTTGWTQSEGEIADLAAKSGGTVLRSSNFSTGVNMFFRIVEEAVKILEPFSEYDIATWEMHHNQKADSPSGTALEIARRILANTSKKTEIETDAFHERPQKNALHVSSTRCGSVPGTHSVIFDGPADTIEIRHTARSREGFAMGAVRALKSLDDALKTGRLPRGKLYDLEDLE